MNCNSVWLCVDPGNEYDGLKHIRLHQLIWNLILVFCIMICKRIYNRLSLVYDLFCSISCKKCGVQSIWICNLCAVCMGVKIGLLLEGKNIKGYLRTGFWGKMLWPKEVQIPGRCGERHDEEFCGLFSAVNDIRACFLKLCGTCISTGTPTIGYWYVALIKNQK